MNTRQGDKVSALSVLVVTTLVWTASIGGAPSPQAQSDDIPPSGLPAARGVAQWLRTIAQDVPEGRAWPGDAADPSTIELDLGSGTAGVLLFWIQQHRLDPTGDSLEQVRRGADYLAAHRTSSVAPWRPGEWTTSLYGPIAGSAFALHESYRLTKEERHRQAALALVEVLHAAVARDASGASWGPSHDVLLGAAGTGLFLLYAAQQMDHAASGELARDVGRRLLLRGVSDSKGGMTWKSTYENRFVLPNFSHGPAGIGYFLAALHEHSQAPEFLAGALQAATWLQNEANDHGGGFRLFYGWPDPGWQRPYDIGWAHGPAGTARLFHKLWQITGDERWRTLVERCALSLRISGIPGTPRPEYGRDFELNQRFGMAGVARFFLDLHETSRRPADLDFARDIATVIAGRAVRDERGWHWPGTRPQFLARAGQPARFASYFYGAAGYGLLFQAIEVANRGGTWTFRLPDDPLGTPVSRAGREPRLLPAEQVGPFDEQLPGVSRQRARPPDAPRPFD